MKSRHSVEQIIWILREIERGGLKISDARRPHGISKRTYYRWRNKYGGMEVSEALRLKGLGAVHMPASLPDVGVKPIDGLLPPVGLATEAGARGAWSKMSPTAGR
jgi:hypothetical protein